MNGGVNGARVHLWDGGGRDLLVEYDVLVGTVTVEAKESTGELGVLKLDTLQARQLQRSLFELLGPPLGTAVVS